MDEEAGSINILRKLPRNTFRMKIVPRNMFPMKIEPSSSSIFGKYSLNSSVIRIMHYSPDCVHWNPCRKSSLGDLWPYAQPRLRSINNTATHFTDVGRMEGWVNHSATGFEPGNTGLRIQRQPLHHVNKLLEAINRGHKIKLLEVIDRSHEVKLFEATDRNYAVKLLQAIDKSHKVKSQEAIDRQHKLKLLDTIDRTT